MNHLETRPACLIDGLSPEERDRKRVQILEQLNLLEASHVPVFEEASQMVSRSLTAPICLLSILDQDRQLFKSAVGLSSLGLMNQLAAARMLPRQESFCTHVVESAQVLTLGDTTQHPAFSTSLLVQQYGIQAYLGVPLFTSDGDCIGTLAVMDLMPRQFTPQEIAFLELNARWCMSEYEKQILQQQLQSSGGMTLESLSASQGALSGSGPTDLLALSKTDKSARVRWSKTFPERPSQINAIRLGLISQLTQDLRNPLTAITGMASMLSREIYGPLTEKQQEYARIVLDSSQDLLTLVDEIISVGGLEEDAQQLSLAPIDIEMLARQSLKALDKLVQQQDLKLNLSIEPGSRIWVLDKRVVKQLIYQLVSSIIKMSTAGSTLRLHISRKDNRLNFAIWLSNPWLGEDLPQSVVAWGRRHLPTSSSSPKSPTLPVSTAIDDSDALLTRQEVDSSDNTARYELGLLLSLHLTQMHQGSIAIQGALDTGYRLVVSLPSLKAT
ncbi:MAG: GAF domain-containing sensor histidine kinase [Cyanobacteria bacterium P01_G01_bin.38]